MVSRHCVSTFGIQDGDLMFFSAHLSGSEVENAIKGVYKDGEVFHVGMLCCETEKIIHCVWGTGVVCECIDSYLKRENIEYYEIFSIKTARDNKKIAVRWALSKQDCAYNDIFSNNCINSLKAEAYYCSQLIIKAYETCAVYLGSPAYTLNFLDCNGCVASFWSKYFANLSIELPQGYPGSHPAELRKSEFIELRLVRNCRSAMGKLHISKTVDAVLHFAFGGMLAPESKNYFSVVQPRNGEVLTKCACAEKSLIDSAIDDARSVQPIWNRMGAKERGAILGNASRIIKECANELAYLETVDSGKPIYESRSDIASCIDCFQFYAGAAHNLRGDHFPLAVDGFAYTHREPWGVVGAIGVWNYPLQAASWKIAPALMCGNAVIYKPSPLAPVTPFVLAKILQKAGLPDGVLSVLQGGAETGKLICEHIGIDKISFTGSTETGGKVYASSSLPGRLKPVTLELGGKSSCIMFDDADVDTAVIGALMANFYAQGQVCSNASKILVQRSIYDEFKEKVVQATMNIVVGDPLEEDTRHGALISKEQLLRVKSFISEAVHDGAKLLCGGKELVLPSLENGFYLSPAVLENISEKMRIYREEVFGAAMLLIPFDNVDDAVRLANDSPYGLAAGVFTRDLKKSYMVASMLKAGNVYVNTFNDTNSMVPFGGMKQSGFGRENGIAGLETFSQTKSVFVNASSKLNNPFST